jgi:hypothetical protein
MKILITNQQMWPVRGSESWCFAVGSELVRRGHDVYIYSPMPREGIPYFAQAGIKYVTSGDFDLVLENHKVITHNFRFHQLIHTCHGRIREESPMTGFVNVAVNEITRKFWNLDTVIQNGIDTDRMKPTREPSKEIRNVLSLCSSKEADEVLKQVCVEKHWSFWPTTGQEHPEVENLINWADIVFGVGRSCLDAMSCGRPVISFDSRPYIHPNHGLGYLTPEILDSDTTNLTGPNNTWTVDTLMKEIDKYNPADGLVNRNWVINNRNIKDTVDGYLEIYDKLECKLA